MFLKDVKMLNIFKDVKESSWENLTFSRFNESIVLHFFRIVIPRDDRCI